VFETTSTKITILVQGKPVVNDAYIYRPGESVVAIGVDMRSKYCEVAAMGGDPDGPVVDIEATERSLYLADEILDLEDLSTEHSEQNDLTEIRFDEFQGWSVWSANIFRYTLAVCLIKNEIYTEEG
jgi:hypothetical protein